MGQHTSLHLTRSVATSVKPPGRSLHPSRCSSLYGTTASPRGSCCRRRDAPGRRGCCLATTSRNGVFASRAAALHSCGLEAWWQICSVSNFFKESSPLSMMNHTIMAKRSSQLQSLVLRAARGREETRRLLGNSQSSGASNSWRTDKSVTCVAMRKCSSR